MSEQWHPKHLTDGAYCDCTCDRTPPEALSGHTLVTLSVKD
jgi:hypothetical protein